MAPLNNSIPQWQLKEENQEEEKNLSNPDIVKDSKEVDQDSIEID